jgi:hypothetical protein
MVCLRYKYDAAEKRAVLDKKRAKDDVRRQEKERLAKKRLYVSMTMGCGSTFKYSQGFLGFLGLLLLVFFKSSYQGLF